MNQQLISKYDSDFCGSLPIHLINVIQPYGVLLVVERSSGQVAQVSENIEELFDLSPERIVGTLASDYFNMSNWESISDTAPYVLTIKDKKYLGILHHKDLYDILEINLESANEAESGSFVDVYQELKHAINAIESADTLTDAARIAAAELKKASGLDKVMIYRFDEFWNGFVMAEDSEADMESYFQFTFPASDIPKQARELYLKNSYRLIPDRQYEPVKLYPFINPVTETFIDMSDCNIRGVSTVHLEYLKNMKVIGSMSTRIIKDEKLWGLIACHHKTPIRVNYKMCAVFELLSGIISSKISSLENAEKHSFDSYLSNIYTSMMEDAYRKSDLAAALLHGSQNILDLFHAGGVVMLYKGRVQQKGKVPDTNAIDDLLLWLASMEKDTVYQTNNLSGEYDYAKDYRDVGSGLLALPVDSANGEYLLLFRPEVVKVINWGGDPETRINFEKDLKTYHPRFSFKLWQEKVSGVAMPWQEEELAMANTMTDFVRDYLNKENISYRKEI